MQSNLVKTITVQELYDTWQELREFNYIYIDGYSRLEIKGVSYGNPIKSFCLNIEGGKWRFPDADETVLVFNSTSQDLDATLPIIPTETAQRDHDRIVQLEAENARLSAENVRIKLFLMTVVNTIENSPYNGSVISAQGVVNMLSDFLKELDQ